jgi:5-methylcytosine-specific restriction endonuclease McrA
MTKHFFDPIDQSNHRCVYCGSDLRVDFETFIRAEEGHLIPLNKGGSDCPENIVIACVVCNTLKGDFAPSETFDPARRDRYIIACRTHIRAQRAKHIATLLG